MRGIDKPLSYENIICSRCRRAKFNCICHYTEDFLDDKFAKEQIKLIPKKVISYINNTKPLIVPARKNMHSISGMKGIALLKRIDKR